MLDQEVCVSAKSTIDTIFAPTLTIVAYGLRRLDASIAIYVGQPRRIDQGRKNGSYHVAQVRAEQHGTREFIHLGYEELFRMR
jgi:hypothetical protein